MQRQQRPRPRRRRRDAGRAPAPAPAPAEAEAEAEAEADAEVDAEVDVEGGGGDAPRIPRRRRGGAAASEGGGESKSSSSAAAAPRRRRRRRRDEEEGKDEGGGPSPHPLGGANSRLGDPVGSRRLLNALMANDSSSGSSSTILIEEGVDALLSISRRCLRAAAAAATSASASTKEGARVDEGGEAAVVDNLRVAAHCLGAACPVLVRRGRSRRRNGGRGRSRPTEDGGGGRGGEDDDDGRRTTAALKLLYHATVTASDLVASVAASGGVGRGGDGDGTRGDGRVLCLASFRRLGQLVGSLLPPPPEDDDGAVVPSSDPGDASGEVVRSAILDLVPAPTTDETRENDNPSDLLAHLDDVTSERNGGIGSTRQLVKLIVNAALAVSSLLSDWHLEGLAEESLTSEDRDAGEEAMGEFGPVVASPMDDSMAKSSHRRPLASSPSPASELIGRAVLPWSALPLLRRDPRFKEEEVDDALGHVRRAHRQLWDRASKLDALLATKSAAARQGAGEGGGRRPEDDDDGGGAAEELIDAALLARGEALCALFLRRVGRRSGGGPDCPPGSPTALVPASTWLRCHGGGAAAKAIGEVESACSMSWRACASHAQALRRLHLRATGGAMRGFHDSVGAALDDAAVVVVCCRAPAAAAGDDGGCRVPPFSYVEYCAWRAMHLSDEEIGDGSAASPSAGGGGIGADASNGGGEKHVARTGRGHDIDRHRRRADGECSDGGGGEENDDPQLLRRRPSSRTDFKAGAMNGEAAYTCHGDDECDGPGKDRSSPSLPSNDPLSSALSHFPFLRGGPGGGFGGGLRRDPAVVTLAVFYVSLRARRRMMTLTEEGGGGGDGTESTTSGGGDGGDVGQDRHDESLSSCSDSDSVSDFYFDLDGLIRLFRSAVLLPRMDGDDRDRDVDGKVWDDVRIRCWKLLNLLRLGSSADGWMSTSTSSSSTQGNGSKVRRTRPPSPSRRSLDGATVIARIMAECHAPLSALIAYGRDGDVTSALLRSHGKAKEWWRVADDGSVVPSAAPSCAAPAAAASDAGAGGPHGRDVVDENGDRVRRQALEMASDSYLRSASLFDRIHIHARNSAVGAAANGDGSPRSSPFLSSIESADRSLHFAHLLATLALTEDRHRRRGSGTVSLAERLLENTARGAASLGKKRAERSRSMSSSTADAVYPLLLSVRLFSLIRKTTATTGNDQLGVRYSYLASILQGLDRRDEAVAAHCLSVRCLLEEDGVEDYDGSGAPPALDTVTSEILVTAGTSARGSDAVRSAVERAVRCWIDSIRRGVPMAPRKAEAGATALPPHAEEALRSSPIGDVLSAANVVVRHLSLSQEEEEDATSSPPTVLDLGNVLTVAIGGDNNNGGASPSPSPSSIAVVWVLLDAIRALGREIRADHQRRDRAGQARRDVAEEEGATPLRSCLLGAFEDVADRAAAMATATVPHGPMVEAGVYLVVARSLLSTRWGTDVIHLSHRRGGTTTTVEDESMHRRSYELSKKAHEILLREHQGEVNGNCDGGGGDGAVHPEEVAGDWGRAAARVASIAARLASVGLFVADLSEGMPELKERSAAPLDDPSARDEPHRSLLDLCSDAASALCKIGHPGGGSGDATAMDGDGGRCILIRRTLSYVASMLHGRFSHAGSTLLAARAACVLSLLDEDDGGSAAGELWSRSAAASALADGGMHDLARRFMMGDRDGDPDDDVRADDSGSPPSSHSEMVRECIELEGTAVRIVSEARCSPTVHARALKELRYGLSKLEAIIARISSEKGATHGGTTEGDGAARGVVLRRQADWTAATFRLSLAEVEIKMGGNASASLRELRECCGLCKVALHGASRRPSTSTTMSTNEYPGNDMAWRWRWTGRLARTLHAVSSCYSALGERRRAEGYSIAAHDVLRISMPSPSSPRGAARVADLLDGCDGLGLHDLNCRQVESLRRHGELRALASVPPTVARAIPKTRLTDCANGDDGDHQVPRTDSEGIPPRTVSVNVEGSAVKQIHWQIESIRSLISRGDVLRRGSVGGRDNGFVRCYELAHQLLTPLLTREFGIEVESALTHCNEGAKSSFSGENGGACLVGTLQCSLKLRQARCLEILSSGSDSSDAARELYEEVRTSPYTTNLERAKSLYRLGRMQLTLARESGELHRLWEGHSTFEKREESPDGCASTFTSESGSESEQRSSSSPLSLAVRFFTEANARLPTASHRLSRRILRCLALALGPHRRTGGDGMQKNHDVSSAALLVHRSIGATVRQRVARAYADSNDDRDDFADDGQFSDADMRLAFDVLDRSWEMKDDGESSFDRFLDMFANLLPSKLNVVAITLCPTGELLFASFTKAHSPEGGTAPNIVARVVCVFPGQPADDDDVVQERPSSSFRASILQPLDEILDRSKKQLSGMDHDNVRNFGREAKRSWWKDRQDVDDQLRALLEMAEDRYFASRCIRDIALGGGGSGDCVTDGDVADMEPCDGSDVSDVSRLEVGNLADKFEAACAVDDDSSSVDSGDENDYPALSREDCAKMTVAQLKVRLEDLGVAKKTTRGMRKANLIDLLIAQCGNEVMATNSTGSGSDSRNASFEQDCDSTTSACSDLFDADHLHESNSLAEESSATPVVVLVLDERLHRFPWEGMQLFRGIPVCRIPSLPFAIASFLDRKQSKGEEQDEAFSPRATLHVDPRGASYVIDPESNLLSTRTALKPVIDSFLERPGWNWTGVMGEIPAASFFEHALMKDSNLLIYCGHGGGECCYSRSQVEDLLGGANSGRTLSPQNSGSERRRCRSTVILMGCSSGRLSSGGSGGEVAGDSCPMFYEPDGIATAYLSSGSPCVVGNLWDVTDRDIDRFCVHLLENFLGPPDDASFANMGLSLPQCVSDARDVCKMRYIVGCAPVCYGIPVHCTR